MSNHPNSLLSTRAVGVAQRYAHIMTSRASTESIEGGAPENFAVKKFAKDLIASIELGKRPELATMLYGSYARGTAKHGSDIDFLQLVPDSPESIERESISITRYTPTHLRLMAQEGSLFVLHLKTEGLILDDPTGTLQRCLDSYEAPASYDYIKSEIAVAAAALNPELEDAGKYLKGLGRLAIYLLRTIAYIRCIELGNPSFDIDKVGATLQDFELAKAIKSRREVALTLSDLTQAFSMVKRYIPEASLGSFESVEQIAVEVSSRRHAAALLAGVISGLDTMDYTAIALPPL